VLLALIQEVKPGIAFWQKPHYPLLAVNNFGIREDKHSEVTVVTFGIFCQLGRAPGRFRNLKPSAITVWNGARESRKALENSLKSRISPYLNFRHDPAFKLRAL
jgi:hypothetical protein